MQRRQGYRTDRKGIVVVTLTFLLATIGMVGFIGAVVVWILSVIGYWKVFEKAGVAGWKCFIPFYNEYVAYGISWKSYFFLIVLIANFIVNRLSGLESQTILQSTIVTILGLVTMVIQIIYSIRMAKSFGHGIGFAIGLFFIPVVFVMILGFGSSTYRGQPDTLI